MNDMPRVAIIYLLYNGRRYIADCFDSLDKMRYKREDVALFVIDNKSTDDTLAVLDEELSRHPNLPPFTIIKNEQNVGFAEGNNVGISLAIRQKFDYVYLLNQDTEVSPDFLTRAVEVAGAFPAAGAVQSLILLHDEKNLVNSWGNAIHYLGFGYANGYKREAKVAPRDGAVLAYASGAGTLYRLTLLRVIGGFDKELFLYHEDLDLGWRIRLAGYTNILALGSRIYHKYEFSRSIKKYYWMERNRFIVLLKLYRLPTLLLLAPALFISELGLLLMSAKSGWLGEKVRGYKYFLSINNWKNIFKTRNVVQRGRKMSDCEIVDLFTSSILFQDFKNPFVVYFVNPVLTLYWIIARAFIFW